MAEKEKDGVFGRGGGWETGKNWMGNLMGHEICQGCWKGRGRYIGRVIARGRKRAKFWKGNCQGGVILDRKLEGRYCT